MAPDRKGLAVVLAVALASAVAAQENETGALAPEAARERLARFLTEGELAPFAGRTHEVALEGVTLEQPFAEGELAFARPGEFVASVGSRGDVTFFSRSRPLLYVEGAGKARAAELARRARHSLDDDAALARRFVEDHYPDFRERRFELASRERADRDSLVEDEFAFVERPRAGVVACWPNRVDVSVNPEDGSVTTYMARNDRIESTVEPALDAAAARRALVAALGDRVKAENRDFLAERARAELIAARDRGGRSRTAWLVAGIFIVDAASGEVLARREK